MRNSGINAAVGRMDPESRVTSDRSPIFGFRKRLNFPISATRTGVPPLFSGLSSSHRVCIETKTTDYSLPVAGG
jgi:hypothetical protein